MLGAAISSSQGAVVHPPRVAERGPALLAPKLREAVCKGVGIVLNVVAVAVRRDRVRSVVPEGRSVGVADRERSECGEDDP
jgi:hypothetical protein